MFNNKNDSTFRKKDNIICTMRIARSNTQNMMKKSKEHSTKTVIRKPFRNKLCIGSLFWIKQKTAKLSQSKQDQATFLKLFLSSKLPPTKVKLAVVNLCQNISTKNYGSSSGGKLTKIIKLQNRNMFGKKML